MSMRIFVLGNGAAGAEKQALALAARLHPILAHAGATSHAVQLIRVPLKQDAIFQKMPPALQLQGARVTRDPFFGYAATDDHRHALQGNEHESKGPWRRVVIGCGRTTVALCAALKRPWATAAPSDAIFNIQIQHPRVALAMFDAVITPRHDVMGKSMVPFESPANLYTTYGTVCSVNYDRLHEEGEKWQDALRAYIAKRTRVLWLIGGPCRGFAFSEREAHEMAHQVLDYVKRLRPTVSLLVTFSRRTPRQVQEIIRTRLQSELDGDAELFLWNGSGANPFDAMLHHATTIVVTPDSISMTTEAISTGKPVLIVCADCISGKFRHFHETLLREGFTSALSGNSHGTAPIISEPSPSRGREAIETELDSIAAALAARILGQ